MFNTSTILQSYNLRQSVQYKNNMFFLCLLQKLLKVKYLCSLQQADI